MSLRTRPKQSTAESKAWEIIQKLGITIPSEIDLIKIAALRKIPIRERPLRGCDGMMVRRGKRAIISISSHITDPKKKRFVIAHELGHVLLHEHIQQADNFSMSKFQLREYRSSDPETEANIFAAELLMPKHMFCDAIDKGISPCFDEIERLSDIFTTSLSATAIQYVKYRKEPCAFICSKNLGSIWWYKSDTFEFRIEHRDKVHAYSVAADAVKHGLRSDRASDVPAGVWLEEYSDSGKDYITEESLVLGSTGIVYTLLWLHEAI
ncbi:MAG: ImmA/IrrE family metallo-endopeptidase [Kiritimatiellae bacterium]|jgi:Zn-dependent peptidase ImmA (M78 family)|nr:ImmA/IrrE family metallo-endopeptidase [Kiritimatiellia bacterium]